MRRKLIKQDAFENIEKTSVTTAERELVEAEHILTKSLGKGQLELKCFNESTVVYQTPQKTYVHAGYEIKNDHVTLNNIEELVIDESSRKDSMRGTLSEMIDAVLVEDHAKAKKLFTNYLEMVQWNEGNKNKNTKAARAVKEASLQEAAMQACETAGLKDVYVTAQNVLDYVDHMRNGPALSESVAKRDEKGNITDLRIPTNEARNDARIKSFNWVVPNAKNHDVRSSVPALTSEQSFCEAIANLRRQDAFSDQEGLEEALDHIVQKYPQLLMVTQTELADLIGEALSNVNVSNYDDKHCAFMAEGILRHAHDAYQEKVSEILTLAGAPKCEAKEDSYNHFQDVVHQFYPTLDHRFGLERKAFSDLYESLEKVYKLGESERNKDIQRGAAMYLNEIADILNGEIRPDLGIANEAATWIKKLLESNVEGASSSWNVSNKPHLTVSGDHPQMAKNAKVPAVSGRHEGEWGDSAPMISQDNMSYKGGASKTARNNSWGQVGGGEVFPKLKNPYVPKPFGDYTMKGEKGVDKDATGQHHSTWSSSDTWPNLQNPYVPKEAGGEGGKGHKMKDGSETDLVVDR